LTATASHSYGASPAVRSAGRLFRFQVALGALGTLVVAYAVVGVARATAVGAPSVGDLLHACWAVVPAGRTLPSFAVVALAALSATSVVRGGASAFRRIRAQRRLVRALPPCAPATIGGTAVRVFRGDRPRAFCAGLARPRIFVSTGAWRLLSRDELAAVVAHERYHARRRDPARLLVIRVLRDALFFLPVLRDAERRYAALVEVAADEAAVRSAGAEPLASALLHFGEQPGGAVGIAAERVDHLLGEPPKWRLRVSLIVTAALALLGVVALSATAPAGGVSAPLLAMQICRVGMIVAPVIALGMIVRRILAASARR